MKHKGKSRGAKKTPAKKINVEKATNEELFV